MRMRTFTICRYSIIWGLALLCCFSAFAQTRAVKGTVKDEKGLGLPGASIAVKGTANGTVTDMNGNYSLNVKDETAVLVFSFIGYLSQETSIGNRDVINIQLQPNTKQLNEVVVTALGIERDEKALGYAVTKVSGEQLMEARPNNFASALSGKVAGLSLISAGSGPINTTTIKLRGDNSLNPANNQALIVLDGVPMNTGLTTAGVNDAYGAGSGNDVPVDFGNGIANINPDDIESITVLKGASAAALYGHLAANGALIITTKSGSRNKKGLGVTVNTNISFDDVLKWPDYQYEYGQGTGKQLNKDKELYYSYGPSEDGNSTGGTSSAYGPKFDGQLYYQYDPATEGQSPERRPWRPYKDNIKGFWRTGQTISNNVAIEGGNEKGSARASITHTKNEWMMPNTGFERLNTALSLNYKVADKLRLNSKVNFAHKQSDNLPATGYNNQSIAYFMIFQNPSIDLAWYEPRWRQGQNQVEQLHPFSPFIDNPYVIAYDMTNSVDNYSTVGNISATYEITPKLDLMIRSGIDMSTEDRAMQRPFSSANFQKGYFKEQTIFDLQQNTDAMLTYKDKITSRIDVRAMLGGNIMSSQYKRTEGYVDALVVPGVYRLSNGVNNPMMRTVERNSEVHSVFGLMTFSYDDKIFVDVTARNDWSSKLPVKNSSFFYPSINTSFILTDLFRLPTAVSYAKLRLSVAEVGNGGDPYQTNRYYIPSEFAGSAVADYTLFNADLKPEMATNYEAGLEYKLFGGRFGMDINFYRNITRNQIVAVPLDPTTGYKQAFLNSGKVQNQGIEVAVTGKLLDNNNLKWNSTLTWSKNYNEVLELAEDMDGSQIIGYGGNATIIAKVGGTTGDIYGYGFVRNPEGKIVYNKNGLPERPDEIQYIGNAYADWKGGLHNEVSYKNLRFSMLLDGQYGGIVYSQTHHKMSEMGKLEHTLMGREKGFIIGDGVVDNGDGTYSPNTEDVLPVDYYREYYRRANVESNSFDASYLKLREMRLEYSLPKQLLARTKFIQGASVAVYGRNLAMITDFPIFDPETAALNGSQALPGIEMGQLPTPRTYGMNVTLKF
ncbi:SusC/RagA family TonB-linked outer membrane protein [Pontibacter sp. H249]|uniref:SusC/RagA family TonB-linked outer membrane protein n=1 Tax=Pontibacter sp. H249 TaxID=3133420 RepID=UPI0030BF3C26